MAINANRMQDTASIATLEFGDDFNLPLDFRFNDVPHASWVRAYVYDMAATALAQAVNDPTVPNKSRLQVVHLIILLAYVSSDVHQHPRDEPSLRHVPHRDRA